LSISQVLLRVGFILKVVYHQIIDCGAPESAAIDRILGP
jgi:hypothetical protein